MCFFISNEVHDAANHGLSLGSTADISLEVF